MRVLDVRWSDGIEWGTALAPHAAEAKKLLRGFERQLEEALEYVPSILRGSARFTLRKGTRTLHAAMGSHFGAEVDGLAEAIGVEPEALILANLSYDLSNTVGCSTFVARSSKGTPLHARSLDWPFPGRLLKSHLMAFRVRGSPAGDYAMVGWPGFFGALTGVAQGRFSVTVNYVVHTEESGVLPALKRAVAGSWPVPWAVRIALDSCRTFKAAVRFLSQVELLSPVLFTVAGTRPGEAVTIERGPADYLQRSRGDGTTVTTNHYLSEEYEESNFDLEDMSTVERLEELEAALDDGCEMTPGKALKVLARGWVNDENTQHRCVMSAAEGLLVVQVPGGKAVSVQV